jgi:hypothetical protein
MAPVAVPSTALDELKLEAPKTKVDNEKTPDVVNEEEGDEDEEDEAEADGGETGATGGELDDPSTRTQLR